MIEEIPENLKTIDNLHETLVRHLSENGEISELSTKFKSLIKDFARVDFTLQLLIKYKIKIENIMVKKNDIEAVTLRNNGNQMYKEKKGKEAFECYNKSAGFAQENSATLGLSFANRSAVLFEHGLIKECLVDIQKAIDNNYPESLRHKLLVRQKNAKNLNPPLSELYHEAIPSLDKHNLHIQSASDAVKIENDPIHGRHIVAAKDIGIGEILAVEKPFVSVLVNEFYTHCHECLELCYNLMPCTSCVSAFYCSEVCRVQAQGTYHQYECPIITTLRYAKVDKLHWMALKIMLSIKNEFGNNFDLNTEEIYRSDRYKEIHNLCTNTEKRSVSDLFERALTAALLFDLVKNHTKFFEDCDKNFENFAKEILFKHLQTGPSNFHQISELVPHDLINCKKDDVYEPEEIGSGAYSFLSLLNHSCDPNVVRNCYGNTIVLRAIKTIRKGEQLFDNYGYHFALADRAERQTQLKQQYYFDCNCRPCKENWPNFQDLSQLENLPEIENEVFKKLGQAELVIAKDVYDDALAKLYLAEASIPCRNFCQIQETLKQCLAIFGNKRRKL